jgi:hypothetical protein
VVDLTGFPAVDVAIGLAFLYFLLSTVCSAINEGIATVFAKRAKNLEQAVARLLGDGDPKNTQDALPNDLSPYVFDHWRIKALVKDPNSPKKRLNRPSYISARAFSRAVAEVIAAQVGTLPASGSGQPAAAAQPDSSGKTPWQTADDKLGKAVQDVLSELPPGGARGVLQKAGVIAQGNLERFRIEIEAAFDDTMSRASGWYKRHTQVMLLLIATGLTLTLNVDSLRVGDRLWKSPELRSAVVAKSSQQTPDSAQTVADRVNAVKQLSLPVGWGAENAPTTADTGEFILGVGRRIPGWVITIFAVSLGAPFWFDALSRVSRLRGSGVPEQPKTLSDRPPPVTSPPGETEERGASGTSATVPSGAPAAPEPGLPSI